MNRSKDAAGRAASRPAVDRTARWMAIGLSVLVAVSALAIVIGVARG
jgi:hypothetical protein